MEKNNEIKNVVVETYAEDMAKVIEDDKSGLIKKIIQAEEQHEIEKLNLSPESKKNKLFMLVGLLLIALGVATLVYFIALPKAPTVPVEKQFTPMIFNDKSVFVEVLDLKREDIIQTVSNLVNATLVKKGGVEGLYLTENKRLIGLRRFVALINGNFIPTRNVEFVSDNFMLGVVNGETKDFFALLQMRSMTDIFNSMREWEKKMFTNLHGFFGIELSPETKYLLTADFEDGIVGNKNARVLYFKENEGKRRIAMMYVFAEDSSLIITGTIESAHEIMLRLAASQIKK